MRKIRFPPNAGRPPSSAWLKLSKASGQSLAFGDVDHHMGF